ncbi:hypothetical protein [Campylobacter devanensis]|uniref:hypothetical protein n=1 Tax=Campylobacter devanensis TaxID=3161138 RepID=UPI000A341259|nr:hypothetical protein [Campylobacter sp. P0107]
MGYDIATGKITSKIGRGCVEFPPILEDKNSEFWGYEGELVVLKNSGILCLVLEDIAENDKDTIENLKNSSKIMYLSSFIGKDE